jgi:hypothetical protein
MSCQHATNEVKMRYTIKQVRELAQKQGLDVWGKSGHYVVTGGQSFQRLNEIVEFLNGASNENKPDLEVTTEAIAVVATKESTNNLDEVNACLPVQTVAEHKLITESSTVLEGVSPNYPIQDTKQSNEDDELWASVVAAKTLKSQSLVTAYSFDPHQALICCGDLLYPERLRRGEVLGGFRFFRCDPSTYLINFAVFSHDEDIAYIGHIFHDKLSGLWVAGDGAFLTPFDAAMEEKQLYLEKINNGVQRNQFRNSTKNLQSFANRPPQRRDGGVLLGGISG